MKRLHAEGPGLYTAADDTKPSSFRARLQTLPPLERGSLYANQVEAVTNLEHSFKRNRPRALIQMATGSGKTIAAFDARESDSNLDSDPERSRQRRRRSAGEPRW